MPQHGGSKDDSPDAHALFGGLPVIAPTKETSISRVYAILFLSAILLAGCDTSPSGALCGNDIREFGEQCDGTNVGGATCPFGGEVVCTAQCTLDVWQAMLAGRLDPSSVSS